MATSFFLVRALYDFNSTDTSSLSFKKNDTIQVLTQLESGWWDGLCNGRRGWFPSNYVMSLSEDEEFLDDEDKSSDWIQQHTPDGDIFYYNNRTGNSAWELPTNNNDVAPTKPIIRDSTFTNGGDINNYTVIKPRQLPKNCVQPSTEESDAYKFYNTQTKEIMWTYPDGGSTTTERANYDAGEDKDVEEIDVHIASVRVEDEVVDELEDAEAADKESIISSSGSRLSISTIGTIQQRQQNWKQQPTDDNSLDNVDGESYMIKTENDDTHGASSDYMDEARFYPLPPTPTAAIPPSPRTFVESSIIMLQNEQLTWESLSSSIYLNIQYLNLSTKDNMKQEYQKCTNAIVESIRIMLYASGTVEKESLTIRQNRSLKNYHRHIMASLSKLALSTKVASGVWPPPDATQKMKSDADEVLIAVRQFVQAAEHTVDIKQVDPKIVENETGGAWRGNNLPPTSISNDNYQESNSSLNSHIALNSPSRSLTPDLLETLDHISRTVTKVISLLYNSIRRVIETPHSPTFSNNTLTPQLMSLIRQVVTQVGQFLYLIEDINLEDLDETSQGSIQEFKVSKQALYNNIASLVICTQSATDPLAPSDSIEQVQNSTNIVEKSVKDVIIATKFLVEEKDTQDQLRSNVRVPRRSSITEVPPNKRRVTSSYVSGGSATTTSSSLDQIHENNVNDNINDIDTMNDQVVSSTIGSLASLQVSTTGLQTVPENDIMTTDLSKIVGDTGIINEYDQTPISPASDGSSMTGGRSMTSSRFRSDSSATSFDSTSIQTHSSLQRTNSQPVTPLDDQYSYSILPGSKMTDSKVKKFFGEDVQPHLTHSRGQREDKPWFLDYDYDPSEVFFNMENVVKGGTLNALIERLTMHDLLDSNFIATFLLTYRSFCTTDEFFDLLVKRFMILPPNELTPEELEVWQEKKQTPIRLRVFNIMKSWLENYYIDDQDSHCLERIREFANTTMHEHMAFAAVGLTKVIDKRQQQPIGVFREMTLNTMHPPPSPILPKNMKKIKFLDLDPLEIARQLTIIEAKLYNKIRPVECLNKAWSKEEGGEIAENIKAMIVNSNQITGWVAESILNQQDIKRRCALIKQFVSVADKCRILNNFNSLTAIISSLNSAPIHRLKRTWEMVNARTIQTLDTLNQIMNSSRNFSDYREMLHSVNPPCVPFLGVYLTDLTFIEDGNHDTLKKSRQLINFSKRMKTAEVIREIQQYQSVPYNLASVQEIQIFIKSHLQDSRDVGDLYDLSLEIEPREREDEKIARLLQESGFL